jgi:putative SOS response-associated peptidase YedK
MCGRYERRGDKQKIAEAFHVRDGLDGVDFGEDFDCAPGSMQPVVWMKEEGELTLGLMRWGFKLPEKLFFNVRSEGVATANFWKDKFATNRCIVPASSFFEWKGKKAPKLKYKITVLDREFFGIAGVWAEWRNPKTQKWEKTFATFTSEPNRIMRELHDRQPIILDPKDFQEWLSPSERLPVHLLRILPDDAIQAILLGDRVAKPPEEPPPIKGLFDH